ncbi:MAG: hypothetical protein M1839_007004 [Geoglossum umbratile]|nr:MAG: hypothetical protein M1839_007004 [Geoglossum umbratile]
MQNSSVSLVSQKQAAKDSKFMLQPGEDFPSEGGPSSAVTASATTATSTSATSTSATATTAAAGGHQGLSPGAIAGIAIGSSAVVLMAAALFFLLGRQRTFSDVIKRESYVAAGKDSHGPRRGSMSGGPSYGFSPGTISGSNSDATRKYQQCGDYHDGNGYDPRHPGMGEYLAPVPIMPRNHSPSLLEASDENSVQAPMSPQGSVAGGRYVT